MVNVYRILKSTTNGSATKAVHQTRAKYKEYSMVKVYRILKSTTSATKTVHQFRPKTTLPSHTSGAKTINNTTQFNVTHRSYVNDLNIANQCKVKEMKQKTILLESVKML